MRRESGNKNSSIWLIGDSGSLNWRESLDGPLDARHPARHNIWTSVLDGIQRRVFLDDRRWVDDSQLYVRNAVHIPGDKPRSGALEWSSQLLKETDELGKLLRKYAPSLVFTFGAFAFEFARRSLEKEQRKRFRYWTTKRLGVEFRRTVEEFNPHGLNVFPLLHVSIARGHFLKSHIYFTAESNGNYFDFVAREIGTLFLNHRDTLKIWMEPEPPKLSNQGEPGI